MQPNAAALPVPPAATPAPTPAPVAPAAPSVSTQTIKDDRQLIDRITYLGSLVSRREDIDTKLDVLRVVTARWQQTAPLPNEARSALLRLEIELKTYLVSQDPLRAFTNESLDQRLRKMENADATSANLKSFWAVLIFTFAAASLAFIAPPYDSSLAFRALLSIPLFFFALHIGISWFYLTALRNFNQELRRVFYYFCGGFILLSLAFSHYVALDIFRLDQYSIFRYGGITWFISTPFIFLFLGLRRYAKLVGVKSRLISLPVAFGIAALVSLAIIIAPHTASETEAYFDLWTVGAAMIPIFALMGSVLAKQIRRSVTPAYAIPMGWMYRYLLLVGLGAITAIGALFWFGELHGQALNIVTATCGVAPQLLLLYTGYSFKKETSK